MPLLNKIHEDELLEKGYDLVVGIDEVGRGCWAGPMYFCAFVYKGEERVEGVKDSKKLSKLKREKLHKELIKFKHEIWEVTVEAINENGLGIAMNKGLKDLIAFMKKKYKGKRIKFLIDGYFKGFDDSDIEFIIKGDDKIYSIGAASIIAKVERDNLMAKLAIIYPWYGFEKNVGYGTLVHQERLKEYGLTGIHRRNYRYSFSVMLNIHQR